MTIAILPIRLAAQELTSSGFARFGQVIDSMPDGGRIVNQGRARRVDDHFDLSHDAAAHRAVLVPLEIEASTLPFPVKVLERHVLSPQVFVPLDVARYLVVVAPSRSDGLPDAQQVRAFVGKPGIGVIYRAGVWHAPMIALDRAARFVMMMFEERRGRDFEEWPVDQEIVISA